MAASMDPRWRQSRTIPDPAPDGTKVDRDYKQAEQASPPWTRQDGPSCTTSVGPGVTPPQCSPRPSRQRRDAATCAAWPNGALLFFALLCAIKSYLSKNRRRGRRAGKTEVPGFPEWAPRAHPGKLETSVFPALLPVAEKGKGPGKWEGTGHLGVRGYCMATTRPLPVIRAVSSARMAPGVGCWASVCLVGPQWSSGPYWLYCSRANHETAPLQNQQQQRQPQK